MANGIVNGPLLGNGVSEQTGKSVEEPDTVRAQLPKSRSHASFSNNTGLQQVFPQRKHIVWIQ